MAQARTKPHRERAGAAGTTDSRRTASPNGHSMEMVRHMGETFFDGFASMNREFLRFMSMRLQEDMKAARSFARCRHPSDFVEAELRFMQSLIHHYAENANRMLDIAAQVAGHNLDDMEERMTEIARGPGAAPPARSAA